MTVEITSKGTLDPTIVKGDHLALLNELNLAAAQGKQFVLLEEEGGPYGGGPVILETRNITRVRTMEGTSAFIS
jgi:hypothetical protein